MRWIKCQNCGKVIQADGEKAFCPECRSELKSKSTLAVRTCRECGKIFIGGPRAWYCPECRAERARAQSREHKRKGASRKLGSIDRCEICGKEYIVEGGRQRYCKDCATEAIREVVRAQSIEWNNAHREKISEMKKKRKENRKVCSVCGKQFYSGGPEVTCSAECAKVLKSYNMAMVDYKRGKREKEPTVEEFIAHHARQSGVKGVSQSANGKRWVARVYNKHIGTFDTVEEAAEAVRRAKNDGLDQSH